jgi:hypothetical protein
MLAVDASQLSWKIRILCGDHYSMEQTRGTCQLCKRIAYQRTGGTLLERVRV